MANAITKLAYSIDEHCKMWGYGRNTAYAEIATGELETIKVRGRRLITAEQEERYRLRKEGK